MDLKLFESLQKVKVSEKKLREAMQSKEVFIGYLKDILIPDLRESGSNATADDFEEAIYWMTKK
jgi:hypothetical protein